MNSYVVSLVTNKVSSSNSQLQMQLRVFEIKADSREEALGSAIMKYHATSLNSDMAISMHQVVEVGSLLVDSKPEVGQTTTK